MPPCVVDIVDYLCAPCLVEEEEGDDEASCARRGVSTKPDLACTGGSSWGKAG